MDCLCGENKKIMKKENTKIINIGSMTKKTFHVVSFTCWNLVECVLIERFIRFSSGCFLFLDSESIDEFIGFNIDEFF